MIEKRSFPRLPRDWEIEYQVSKSKSVQPILIKGGIRDLWKRTYGNLEGLRAVYAENPALGARFEAFAR